MDAQGLLKKLQDDSNDGAADRLAALTLETLLQQPLKAYLTQDTAARSVRLALEGWLASPDAQKALMRVVEDTANRLSVDRRALKVVVPDDLRRALREVLGRPFSLDRKLVLTVIDRPPMRELVRGILLDAVLDFAKRASAPVAGVARGLGSLARMAGETVASRSSTLGGIVGAVSGEVERQLEKRAVDFVDAALSGVFQKLADSVSDPRRADEAAELRLALFDGALDLTMTQLSRELINLDVPGGAEVLRASLTRWLATPASDEQVKQLAQAALEQEGERPLEAVLAELGLLEPARTLGREQLRLRIGEVVRAPAFEVWLSGLWD